MSNLALFEKKQVRRVWHDDAWWFVIVDVVAVLTDSGNPSGYLRDMRRRDPSLGEAFKGGGQIAPPLALKVETAGGPQDLLCWHVEGLEPTTHARLELVEGSKDSTPSLHGSTSSPRTEGRLTEHLTYT